MRQISFFHKGISTDLDYSKLDNGGLILPTNNIQIVNKKGQGLIITPVKGNKKAFTVSSGYVIIGACEYNGIAYLISQNPTTGLGEIGSFPTIDWGYNKGFVEKYSPLYNLIVGTGTALRTPVGPMRSKEFKLSLKNPVGYEMVAIPDYDGSVNLVFTDNVNPLRFVNTGFNQDGELNGRYYNSNTLTEEIQLIKPIPSAQKIEFAEQASGGEAKFGNYFFYYRYVTSGGNKTPYVAESQPIAVTQLARDNDQINVSGYNKSSGKRIILSLSGIDPSYPFVEIAFIRKYADTGGVVLTELFQIDKLFSITAGSDTIQVEYTGFETLLPLSVAELLMPVNNENVCKSILGYDRRIWGANWKSKEIDYDFLKEYASRVKLGCDDTQTIPHSELRGFYGKSENIAKAGYFRGEAYIFKVSFKLKNGYETEAFPVMGIDARNMICSQILNSYDSGKANNEGIIITPNQKSSPLFARGSKDARILSVIFNFDDVKSWLEKNPEGIEWFKENVSEVILLRGERKKNIQYQGLVANVYGRGITSGMKDTDFQATDVSIPIFGKSVLTDHSLRMFPIQDGFPTGSLGKPGEYGDMQFDPTGVGSDPLAGEVVEFPMVLYEKGESGDKSTFFNSMLYKKGKLSGSLQSDEERQIRALFSPDYIFGSKSYVSTGDRPYVRSLGSLSYIERAAVNVLPKSQRLEFSGYSPFVSPPIRLRSINEVFDSNNWIYPSNATPLRLINRAEDLGEDPFESFDPSKSMFYNIDKEKSALDIWSTGIALSNRNIQVPPYLGLQAESDKPFSSIDYKQGSIVSVYQNDPESSAEYFLSLYLSSQNIPYSKVTHIPHPAQTPVSVNVFRGDCFVQLTTIKARTWYPSKTLGSDLAWTDRDPVGASISFKGAQTKGLPLNRLAQAMGLSFILAAYVPSVLLMYDTASSEAERQKEREKAVAIRYAHGQLVDIVTENAVNAALRIHTDDNAFFPALPEHDIKWSDSSGGWTVTREDWALFPYSAEVTGWNKVFPTGIESFMVNRGNSATLSTKAYLAFNPNLPKGLGRFPNRIRYTGQQEPNQPFLSYRIWDYAAREDFDERYGPIEKIILLFNRLLSIQRTSIFLHYTNQEEVVPSTTGELVIGVRSILSKRPSVLSHFGTQHPMSVRRGKAGAYGWDWINNTIWRVAMDEDGGMIARSMDKEQLIEKYVRDLRLRVDGIQEPSSSNIMRGLKNDLFNVEMKDREGIITGYDPTHNEVLFCIGKEGRYEILKYSESSNSFMGHLTFPAQFFFNLQSDLFSVESTVAPNREVYVHGKGDPAVFYEKPYSPVFSFIVNGIEGETNFSIIEKLFKAMEIESPKTPVPIEKITFETVFQSGANTPFDNKEQFWLTPEYLENKWAFPLNKADYGEEDFYKNSAFVGRWLKVTVTLNKNIDTFVKNIITIFTTSKS